MEMELSVSAIAAVLNPNRPKSRIVPSIHVQGIKKTDPIDTLTARRFSGSQELRVNNTASIPSAAAERKIAPILVLSTTPSITTMRRAFRQTSSTLRSTGRRMAHNTPRVRTYPVSVANSSRLPV